MLYSLIQRFLGTAIPLKIAQLGVPPSRIQPHIPMSAFIDLPASLLVCLHPSRAVHPPHSRARCLLETGKGKNNASGVARHSVSFSLFPLFPLFPFLFCPFLIFLFPSHLQAVRISMATRNHPDDERGYQLLQRIRHVRNNPSEKEPYHGSLLLPYWSTLPEVPGLTYSIQSIHAVAGERRIPARQKFPFGASTRFISVAACLERIKRRIVYCSMASRLCCACKLCASHWYSSLQGAGFLPISSRCWRSIGPSYSVMNPSSADMFSTI